MSTLLRRKIVPRKIFWWEKLLSNVWIKATCVVTLIIFIGVCVPYFITSYFNKLKAENKVLEKCHLNHEYRIDCLPGISLSNQNQEYCERSGCCWEEFGPPVPSCFHSHPTIYTYSTETTEKLRNSGHKIKLLPNFENTTLQTFVSRDLFINIEFWSSDHLRILFDDEKGFDPGKYLFNKNTKIQSRNAELNYDVKFVEKGIFNLQVYRNDNDAIKNGRAIFNTLYGPLIFSQGLTEVTTLLPSFHLYGIGQKPKLKFRHDLKYSKRHELFSRSEFNNHEQPSVQMSAGVHPFYMVVEDDGQAHGVLWVSSLPSEIVTNGIPSVTFRTTDTRIDLHLFLGPSPADVVKQLTKFIGRPAMPPYWALGYHSCRNTSDLRKSIDFLKFCNNKRIPHESDCGSCQLLWPGRYLNSESGLTKFMKELKNTGRSLLSFLSPHIATKQDEEFENNDIELYREILQSNASILVRNSLTNSHYIGFLHNGLKVAYPDFFHNGINEWQQKELERQLAKIDFDGLILNSNTPLNFNVSSQNATSCASNIEANFSSRMAYLNNGTICMDALHVKNRSHLYFHNIYGYKHLISVRKSLSSLKKFQRKRLFLCSLSTFTGSGASGGHWGGLITPSWKTLKESFVQMLDFSLFGIPFYGSPTCGTSGLLDSELCSRWFQLAAFQPLTISYRSDDVDVLYNNSRVLPIGRSMLQLRYSLLPYFYTLFYNATLRGETVIRPIFFEFPQVHETYGIDEQFMWGSGLLVSPVMQPSIQQTKVYFPPGCWYDYYTGRTEVRNLERNKGTYKELSSIEHHINLHIRGGHIIPTQMTGTTTKDSRQKNFTITIAMNCLKWNADSGSIMNSDEILAIGEIFIDDGLSSNTIDNGDFVLISLLVKGRVLTIQNQNQKDERFLKKLANKVSFILNTIHFYGISTKPSKFIINGKENYFFYSSVFESATLDNLNLNLIQNHTIKWEPLR